MMAALHLHTEYSLLDGAIKIKDLFKKAKELGLYAVSTTEHGTMAGTIRKYKLAKEFGVKLIIGCEIYVVKDMLERNSETEKRNHLIVYAKNNEGYKNLIKLTSEAAVNGFYYKPRVDKECLKKYSKGLIASSACMQNDIAQAVIAEDFDKARGVVQEYIDIFGKDNFFLEVANHGIREEFLVADAYFRMAKEFGLRVVFGGDAHYLEKEHADAHAALLCIQSKKLLTDPARFRFDGKNSHLLSESEARALFPDHPEIFDNTVVLADMCNVEIQLGKPIFPDFPLPEGHTNESYLRELVESGMKKRYKEVIWPEVKRRINYELEVINKMGYAEYFLIVQDVIREVGKIEGIHTAGRGSAGGSVVGYCLGIHQAEPIANGLLFERFLNPDRVSLPDIDTDFANRDIAINYVKQKYGADKVALIGTFGTLACKLAVKDTAKVYGLNYDKVNEITKQFTSDNLDENMVIPEVATFFNENPKILESARILQDLIKFQGVHASGVVWGKEAIIEYCPIRLADGQIVTQYDMREIEDIGLVKFDFLGLDTMNIIKDILNMINKDSHWLETISFDDEETFKMLQNGDATGVFQLEHAGVREAMKKIKPNRFEDIVAITSLYRPGSMEYVDVYASRKNGGEDVIYDHPKLEPILKSTMAIPIYQEQLLFMVRELAGFSMGKSDLLRRGIGKKKLDVILSLKKEFVDGCKSYSNIDNQLAEFIWDKIVKFADYGFNKSHAWVYSLTAYRTAYLKCHYPVEFMCAVINSFIGDNEKVAHYVNEARHMGINILPPDINKSSDKFTVDYGEKTAQ